MGIGEILYEEQVKEYTLLALAASLIVFVLDGAVFKTHVMRQTRFWIFILVMFTFKMIVNGFLTWRPIVLYNEGFYQGSRFVTIPFEDFFYGFSLISLTIILWEYFKRAKNS